MIDSVFLHYSENDVNDGCRFFAAFDLLKIVTASSKKSSNKSNDCMCIVQVGEWG